MWIKLTPKQAPKFLAWDFEAVDPEASVGAHEVKRLFVVCHVFRQALLG